MEKVKNAATKILLVDDEPDVEGMILLKFRKQIKNGLYDFIFASNGKEALEKLSYNRDVDIVISDINMPEMDGLTLLKKIGKTNKMLKSIIISAYGDMSNIREAMNSGAYDFVTKPINFQDLEITINKTKKSIEEIKRKTKQLKLMESSLKDAIARNSSIVNTALDAIISFDDHGIIETVNPSAQRLFNTSKYELEGHSFFDFFEDYDTDALIDFQNREKYECVITGTEFEATALRKSGTKIPVEVSLSEFQSGETFGYTAIIRDSSVRKLTEKLIKQYNETLKQEVKERTAELNKLNEEKNDIIGMVAHDLKNPLFNIKLLAKMLNDTKNISVDEVYEFSYDILSTTDKIFSLITNLLDLNAIEQGKINLDFELFDPKELVFGQISSFSEMARNKQIEIVNEMPDEALKVYADINSFSQIIDNLLSNAIKYSPRGSIVKIVLEERNHETIYIVKDQGPGIAPDEIDIIFTKFCKISTQPTAGEDSTGLGLSIVKKLCDMMNGRVWCESTVGKGSEFFAAFKNCNKTQEMYACFETASYS